MGFVAPLSASAAAQTSALATLKDGPATFQAQVDNNPGNGATAWMWLADFKHDDWSWAAAKVIFVDGTTAQYGPAFKTNITGSLPKKVRQFQVCEGLGDQIHKCSGWSYL
ncbi:hypothetical protein FSY75_09140 [Streptomyces sp. TR1341]|uniref:hypothetical protein n=1 Tax=Streptomyces sp. TR1341 TaxID=2601266 RepID=UPI00138AE587|nr:hypothetical protein [Streptomyces sp. TR1341]